METRIFLLVMAIVTTKGFVIKKRSPTGNLQSTPKFTIVDYPPDVELVPKKWILEIKNRELESLFRHYFPENLRPKVTAELKPMYNYHDNVSVKVKLPKNFDLDEKKPVKIDRIGNIPTVVFMIEESKGPFIFYEYQGTKGSKEVTVELDPAEPILGYEEQRKFGIKFSVRKIEDNKPLM